MLARIVIFALIAGLVYLNYTTPKIEDHQAILLAELAKHGSVPESLQERLFEGTDYSNFLVCSFVKTTEGSKLITTGYLGKVKVVNDEWAEGAFKRLEKLDSY